MSNTVNLTTSMSSILYALKNTTNQMDSTNSKLSTGLKVQSALDDPIAYFAAEDHTTQANSLSLLNDNMGEGIQLLNAADEGIESIKDLLDDAKALANSALSADDTTEAADYMAQFNDLLDQIDDLADDSGYAGVNLLGGTSETLEVSFDAAGESKITLTGFDASTGTSGLNIAQQTGWVSGTGTSATVSKTAINAAISSLNSAKTELRSESKGLSTQLSTITARQDFTENMIQVLESGAADLVNADLNEESANLLALQTQQSLGTNSLSIASQCMQSVLNLF
jgi:flagellin